MTIIDWARFRACEACKAELGEPCRSLSGVGPGGPVVVVADRPHGGRPLRTGHGRG